MNSFTFEITEHPSSENIDFLTKKLNEATPDYPPASSFAIFVQNREKQIIAGCNGFIVFGAVYTDQLWVDPQYRKSGLGTKLMYQVHEYGKQKGCTQATVGTMSFQAPDFYQKLGYKIDFSRPGYSKNSSCVFLSKEL